jgi:hypothetical protein
LCLATKYVQRKARRLRNLYTLNYIFENKWLTKLADVTRDIEKWRLECAEMSTQERIENARARNKLEVRWPIGTFGKLVLSRSLELLLKAEAKTEKLANRIWEFTCLRWY